MRYQMILAECEFTQRKYWGHIIAQAKSLTDLWEECGWFPNGYSCEQVIEILDTKMNKKITLNEYETIIRKIKGWTKSLPWIDTPTV